MENTEIFNLVDTEMNQQDNMWGIRDQHPGVWLTILTEEVGEVAKEICEGGFQTLTMDLKAYEEELVQVAAVACQMIKNIKNYQNNGDESGT